MIDRGQGARTGRNPADAVWKEVHDWKRGGKWNNVEDVTGLRTSEAGDEGEPSAGLGFSDR